MSKELYEENKALKRQIDALNRQMAEKYGERLDRGQRVTDMLMGGMESFLKGSAYLSIRPDKGGGFDVFFIGPDHGT